MTIMPGYLRRLTVTAGAFAILLLPAERAAAGLQSCSGVGELGYKILLDDIVASETDAPLKFLLVSKLDANLEQLRTETGLAFRVVACPKRFPSSPADFNRETVQDLTANNVMLEVWGRTAQALDANGAKVHDAEIGYAIVPVRFNEFESTAPPGAFLVPRRAASLDSPEALLQLVDQAGALAAYAALGAGAKLLRGREYDSARTQLCMADVLLAALAGPPGSPDASLLLYVRRLAAEAVTAARADAAYSGPLRAVPIDPSSDCRRKP